MNSYIHDEYEFILNLRRCENKCALTGDAMDEANAEAGAAVADDKKTSS